MPVTASTWRTCAGPPTSTPRFRSPRDSAGTARRRRSLHDGRSTRGVAGDRMPYADFRPSAMCRRDRGVRPTLAGLLVDAAPGAVAVGPISRDVHLRGRSGLVRGSMMTDPAGPVVIFLSTWL